MRCRSSTTTQGVAGPPEWTWTLADAQNSVRYRTAPGGSPTSAGRYTSYYAFGEPVGTLADSTGTHGYLDHVRNPDRSLTLDHRTYHPDLSINFTPDPLLEPTDPQTLNPYSYARNNPIRYSDPSGLHDRLSE